jgi:hypothetical protein
LILQNITQLTGGRIIFLIVMEFNQGGQE